LLIHGVIHGRLEIVDGQRYLVLPCLAHTL
jgi:hypothetical protein